MATLAAGEIRLWSNEYFTKKATPKKRARPPNQAKSFTPMNCSRFSAGILKSEAGAFWRGLATGSAGGIALGSGGSGRGSVMVSATTVWGATRGSAGSFRGEGSVVSVRLCSAARSRKLSSLVLASCSVVSVRLCRAARSGWFFASTTGLGAGSSAGRGAPRSSCKRRLPMISSRCWSKNSSSPTLLLCSRAFLDLMNENMGMTINNTIGTRRKKIISGI